MILDIHQELYKLKLPYTSANIPSQVSYCIPLSCNLYLFYSDCSKYSRVISVVENVENTITKNIY